MSIYDTHKNYIPLAQITSYKYQDLIIQQLPVILPGAYNYFSFNKPYR